MIKMIIDFENFINEFNTMYSFDGSNIKLGSSVLCTDGTSGIIISKKSNEGLVSYKDHKGNTYVANPEELMITKNLKNIYEAIDPSQEVLRKEQWFNVIKFLIILDILKGNGPGGGILNTGSLFPRWREKIQKTISTVNTLENKAIADKITDKIYHNANISSFLRELVQYPYTNLEIKKSFIKKREFNKLQESNNKRRELIKKIANEVWKSLEQDEKIFLSNLNKQTQPLIKEESPVIGTGTYTTTTSDQNYMTIGYTNSKDSTSNGSQII